MSHLIHIIIAIWIICELGAIVLQHTLLFSSKQYYKLILSVGGDLGPSVPLGPFSVGKILARYNLVDNTTA